MNVYEGEEFINQEINQSKFQVTKEKFQRMKTILVTNTEKWYATPPPMYTNEYVSSYQYSKLHFNTYMGFIRNN